MITPRIAYVLGKQSNWAPPHLKKKLRELGGARVPLNNSGLELTLKQAGLCLCLLSAEINVSTTTPGLFSALLEYQVSCESTHGVWNWVCHQNLLRSYRNCSEEMKWVLVIMCGFIFNLLSRSKVSYSSDWPGTYYVAKAEFVLRTLLSPPPNAGISGVCYHAHFFRKKVSFNKDILIQA